MTRPTPPPAAQRQAAVSAAFAGAVDLSALAARAQQPAAPAGAAPGPDAAAPPDPAATPGAPRSPFVIEVTEENFRQLVEASAQVLVVIELGDATDNAASVLAAVVDESGGSWVLGQVDVTAAPRVAQAFGVQAVPTVVALAAGQPVDSYPGVQTEPQVRQWITGLLDALRDRLPGIAAAEAENGGPPPTPEDPRLTAAEELMSDGSYADAEAAFQKILDSEPANADAARGRTAAIFYGRVAAAPKDAVVLADAAPDDVAAQCIAADVQVADGDVAGAFDRLVGAVRRGGPEEKSALREHLVLLFGLFDVDEPQVVAARRSLAAALY